MPALFTWGCSYYVLKKRSWLYGSFEVHSSGFKFVETSRTSSPGKAYTVAIPNNHIVDVIKASSSFVYACLVLVTKSEKHWFSSLPDRDEVHRTVLHFWKEELLDRENRTTVRPSSDLLRIVYSTQDTLTEAAGTLHRQGQQLTSASRNMNLLHNDLVVAGRLTEGLESWKGAWGVTGGMSKEPAIELRTNSPIDTQKIEYSVLVARLMQESHVNGVLLVRTDTIDILDEKARPLHCLDVKQLCSIEVHSSVDMTMIKRCIGKPDVTVHIISTHLQSIVRTLRKLHGDKLNLSLPRECPFKEDVDIFSREVCPTVHGDLGARSKIDKLTLGTSRLAGQQQAPVSDGELSEICRVLGNLKTLASDIGVEQDAQLQEIDDLSRSVARATRRVADNDRKVKKLT